MMKSTSSDPRLFYNLSVARKAIFVFVQSALVLKVQHLFPEPDTVLLT